MRVLCKTNRLTTNNNFEMLVLFKPEGQKDIYDDDYYVTDGGYHDIDSKTVEYDLTPGDSYEVYGIMIYRNIIRYLVICNSFSDARWVQKEIFDITNSKLPYNWYCKNFVSGDDLGTIIGYKELANDYQYLLDLILQKETAVKVFLEYKDNIEYFE